MRKPPKDVGLKLGHRLQRIFLVDVPLFIDGHKELSHVELVGSKVPNELSVRSEVVGDDSELLNDDAEDALLDVVVASHVKIYNAAR